MRSAFGAFDISAEPEQIVGCPARQAARHVAGEAALGRQQRVALDRLVADDPDIGSRSARLHGDRRDIGAGADAGKTAGHDLPAICGAGGEDAQRHRPRHELAVHPGGRRRERDDLLADQFGAVRTQPVGDGILAAARSDEPSTDSPLSSKKGARE